jgi:5'-3' exonuclease
MRGWKIAIDFSNLLYKFVQRSELEHGYLLEFINLIHKFQKYSINVVFVMDGKPPPEKQEVIKSRKEIQNKIFNPPEKFNIQKVYNMPDEDSDEKRKEKFYEYLDKYIIMNKEEVVLLSDDDEKKEDEKEKSNVKEENKRTRSFYSCAYYCKKMFDSMGINYIQMALESDVIFKYLCDYKQVDACYSNDMDLLVYGCPIVLLDLDFRNDVICEYNYKKILETLDLTREQFIDACVLSGTDYNFGLTHSNFEDNMYYIKNYITIENVIANLDTINYYRPRGKKSMVPSKNFNYNFTRQLYNKTFNLEFLMQFMKSVKVNKLNFVTDDKSTYKSIEKLIKIVNKMDNDNKYLFKLRQYFEWKYNIGITT